MTVDSVYISTGEKYPDSVGAVATVSYNAYFTLAFKSI